MQTVQGGGVRRREGVKFVSASFSHSIEDQQNDRTIGRVHGLRSGECLDLGFGYLQGIAPS